MSHAFLSPSGAKRWLTCTPAPHLEKQFMDAGSVYAEEGSLAHAISEVLTLRKLDRMTKKMFDEAIKRLQEDPLYESSMMDYCEDFSVFIMESYATAQMINKDAFIDLETRIDLTEFVPEGFGTVDVSICADKTLHIIDLKYGKGVSVAARDNYQMMTYALGVYRKFETLFEIDNVQMTIFQPRIDNIDTWEINVPDLIKWGEEILKPGAKKAFAGDGEYVPGDHCRFCKAKTICRANAEFNMKVAEHDFADIATLSDTEIIDIYKQYDRIKNWLESLAKYALAEAVKGKEWPGLKVIAGKSNKRYSKPDEIASLLIIKGHKPSDIYVPLKLKGIGELTKELGKADFNKLVEPFLVKPQGKPSLVAEDKPGTLWDPKKAAEDDFANLTIEDE